MEPLCRNGLVLEEISNDINRSEKMTHYGMVHGGRSVHPIGGELASQGIETDPEELGRPEFVVSRFLISPDDVAPLRLGQGDDRSSRRDRELPPGRFRPSQVLGQVPRHDRSVLCEVARRLDDGAQFPDVPGIVVIHEDLKGVLLDLTIFLPPKFSQEGIDEQGDVLASLAQGEDPQPGPLKR